MGVRRAASLVPRGTRLGGGGGAGLGGRRRGARPCSRARVPEARMESLNHLKALRTASSTFLDMQTPSRLYGTRAHQAPGYTQLP